MVQRKLAILGMLSLAAFVTIPLPVAAADATVGGPCADDNTVGVSITNFMYSPSPVNIDKGDIVVWTNNAPNPHTSTEDYLGDDNAQTASIGKIVDPPLWDSGNIAAGGTYSVKFCSEGTFTYHCEVHRFMSGTVVVSGP